MNFVLKISVILEYSYNEQNYEGRSENFENGELKYPIFVKNFNNKNYLTKVSFYKK